MFAVSNEVKIYLANRLDRLDPKTTTPVFRVEISDEHGPRIRLGEYSEKDVCFSHDGKAVLALDQSVADALEDKKLILEETEEKPQLMLA